MNLSQYTDLHFLVHQDVERHKGESNRMAGQLQLEREDAINELRAELEEKEAKFERERTILINEVFICFIRFQHAGFD